MSRKKKFNPYAALGLGPSASNEEIRAAFRRRAKETHPDHGGDRSAFEETTRANLILSNPARRAKYDQTGEIDDPQPANPDSPALAHISTLLATIVEAEGDPFQLDLVPIMQHHFRREIADIRQKMEGVKALQARTAKLQERFSRKTEGENMLKRVLGWRIAGLAGVAEKMELEIKNLMRAIELLKDYDFKRDPPPPQMMGNPIFWGTLR